MWRVMKKVMDLKTHKRNLVNSRKAITMTRPWRTEPKVKGKARANHLHAINVVVQTILPKKYQTPKHLVELYQKSLKESNNNKRSCEAHFNDMTKEASTSVTVPLNPEMPKETDTEDMDMESMIMVYHSNNVFGDLK
jgi:hypothetical protein